MRKMFGCGVSVWVSVMCCCFLLERVCGYFFVVWLRFMCVNVVMVFLMVVFLGSVVKLKWILLRIVRCGKSVKFWNIRFILWCFGGRKFDGLVILWLLRRMCLFDWILILVVIFSSVVLLELEGFRRYSILFGFVISEMLWIVFLLWKLCWILLKVRCVVKVMFVVWWLCVLGVISCCWIDFDKRLFKLMVFM